MKKIIFFVIIFLYILNLHALEVNEKSSDINLIPHAAFFLDKTGKLQKSQLTAKMFQDAKNKEELAFGFIPHAALWIKFTLTNSTNKELLKVIEYSNTITQNIYFFDQDTIYKDGMWNIKKNRASLYPVFTVSLKPHETRLLYIRANSTISSLIANLKLYTQKEFTQNDYLRKTYIFVFFAAILTLFIYNSILFLFTKDKAYFYYILYLFSIMFFQANYLGIAQLYLFSNAFSIFVTKASMLYVSLMIISILLFTREFLNTPQFRKFDFVLKFYLFATPPIALLSYNNLLFNMNIIAFFIPVGIVVVWVSFYAFLHGVKQAKYYVVGWSFVILSLILTNLKTLGIFNIYNHFAYINELAFIFEALLFSIALAHRIKLATDEKDEANRKLIEFQKQQQVKLQNLVDEKTADLQNSLEEKELLYQELNHRVKNNIQMILSLIKLQIDTSHLQETKENLSITLTRIKAISTLYDMLYLQDSDINLDCHAYFEHIVSNIALNFQKKVNISYTISYTPKLNEIIYCGLILNELVTNSFKYAFEDQGKISVILKKEKNFIEFVIKDNGKGFSDEKKDTLGLKIVETLAKKQLLGSYKIDSHNGTSVTIEWNEDE